MSSTMVERFHKNLNSKDFYVGYFDMTFESKLKTYLSFILVNSFIKYKKDIIMAGEDNSDCNEKGYPFEENGYFCKCVQNEFFDVFLSYKIERAVYRGFETDTEMSINAVCDNVFNLSEFDIEIADSKVEYLMNEKTGSMNKVGMSGKTKEKFVEFLKNEIFLKIQSNYIYSMSFLKEYNTIKFNIMLEFGSEATKILLALEYMFKEKKLRLITMY